MGKNSKATYNLADLQYQVNKAWRFQDWSFLSLGLGHYVFKFRNEQERNTCWGSGKWRLEHGSMLYLQEWKPKFVPSKPPKRPVSLVRVWIHLSGLCYEDLNTKTVRSIARALGQVVKIDSESISKGFGKVAKALVDVDLTKVLEHELTIRTAVGNSAVSVNYIDLPLFCKSCNSLGHNLQSCRRPIRGAGPSEQIVVAANVAPCSLSNNAESGSVFCNRSRSSSPVSILARGNAGEPKDKGVVDEDGFQVPKYRKAPQRQWRRTASSTRDGSSSNPFVILEREGHSCNGDESSSGLVELETISSIEIEHFTPTISSSLEPAAQQCAPQGTAAVLTGETGRADDSPGAKSQPQITSTVSQISCSSPLFTPSSPTLSPAANLSSRPTASVTRSPFSQLLSIPVAQQMSYDAERPVVSSILHSPGQQLFRPTPQCDSSSTITFGSVSVDTLPVLAPENPTTTRSSYFLRNRPLRPQHNLDLGVAKLGDSSRFSDSSGAPLDNVLVVPDLQLPEQAQVGKYIWSDEVDNVNHVSSITHLSSSPSTFSQ